MSNCIPPKQIKRNESGLIEGIDYIFDDNGFIDWRRMVQPKYLVPNKLKTQETDITKIPDSDYLLITLAGLKEIAFLRGYHSVYYNIHSSNLEYCSVICTINWIPNFETESRAMSLPGIADANINNTENFAKYYLSSIAENRAFSRAVRNFLRIHIVSDEEVNKEEKTIKSPDDKKGKIDLLEKAMKKKGLTFDMLKEKMIKEDIEGSAHFKSISDLSNELIFDWIGRVKKFKPAEKVLNDVI